MKITNFFKQFGPGIIMASSAVGGSHIIASTQAGIKYGFALAGFIVLVNLLKYPFYKIAFSYSFKNNLSLLDGYSKKGKKYLVIFLFFNMVATIVNIAGGALLSAALLKMTLPFSVSLEVLNVVILLSFVVILYKKQYSVLDIISKNIMIILTFITLIAFFLALFNSHPQTLQNATDISPWSISAIPFLIALMGWMPSPLELSVSSSLWVLQKKKDDKNTTLKSTLFDFNVGYFITIILALIFMALGALITFSNPQSLAGGGRYIEQFVNMYAQTIGEGSKIMISLIAFFCIYGTTITAVDGYSRTNMQAVHLLFDKKKYRKNELFLWIIAGAFLSFIVILFFKSSVKMMIPFAMTLSFISAPIFAWLNLSLYEKSVDKKFIFWAYCGLTYLVAMLVLYVTVKFF